MARVEYSLGFNYGAVDYPATFFHYAHGFMLPGFLQIQRANEREDEPAHFLIESHGELMDLRFSELLQLFGFSFEFVGQDQLGAKDLLLADRWDNMMGDWQFLRRSNGFTKLKYFYKSLKNKRLRKSAFKRKQVVREMRECRQLILNKWLKFP